MSSHSLRTAIAALVVMSLVVTRISAQNLNLQFRTANDAPFKLNGTSGFSVSYAAGEYRLFANMPALRYAWKSSDQSLGFNDAFGSSIAHPGQTFPCDVDKDPRSWVAPPLPYSDVPACIDSIALFSKSANAADDRWTASVSPTASISSVESTTGSPPWPNVGKDTNNIPRYGVPGVTPIISRESIRMTVPNDISDCRPLNATGIATGAANGKAVQVFYNGGISQWYMAFNETIHNNTTGPQDDFRILWATSADGRTWSVYNGLMLRKPSATEANGCVGGFLVTDVFLDEGAYFYMVFTDIGTNNVYLARASYAGAGPSVPGYTSTWQIAGPVDTTGQFQWQTIPSSALSGSIPLSLGSLGATSIIPADQYVTATGYFVKQAAVTRVFASSSSGSAAKYVAVTSDRMGNAGTEFGRLYSSISLSRPFRYEHQDLTSISPGVDGWEPGFTHYPDNLSSSPRVVAQGLDLWVDRNTCPSPGGLCAETVARSTMALTGGIFSNPPSPTGVSVTAGSGAGGESVTISGNNFHSGATVRFGGVAAASVTVISASQISAVAPPHTPGLVSIDVTNNDYPSGASGFTSQTGTLTNAYTYIALASFSVSPASVGGGNSVQITATLTSTPLPYSAFISLSSSAPNTVVNVPSSLLINYGTSGTFTVTTYPVGLDRTVTISASYGGVTIPASLVVHAVAFGGNHDGSSCSLTTGWAWDANRPNTPIQVTITADAPYPGGGPVATWANGYRVDLVNAGIGNGYHGFSYAHPSSLMDGAQHTIYAYAGTPSDGLGLKLLPNSPEVETCPVTARVVWMQPQSSAGFGPVGSLVIGGSATGAPSGTQVFMYWRDLTAGTAWALMPYAPVPGSDTYWYNSIANANYSHQYSVYVKYAAIRTVPCTYTANGGITWCP
jgi:hypothetical protein